MISGVLAFGAIVYGGIKYTLAAGNPSGQSEGKEWVKGALTGLLLLVGAYAILNIINPQLTSLNFLKLTNFNTPTAAQSGSNTSSCPSTGNCIYACIADDGKYACSPGNKTDCSDTSACDGKQCAQIPSTQCGGLAAGTGIGSGLSYGCVTTAGKYACSQGNKSDCSDISDCSQSCAQIPTTSCNTTYYSTAVSSGCNKDVAGTIFQCVAGYWGCPALTCGTPCLNFTTTACNNATMGEVINVTYACVANDGKYACSSSGTKSDCSDATGCSGKPCVQIQKSSCSQSSL